MTNNYSFYVSFPIINKMVDFNNKHHLKLINFIKELENHDEYTKSQTSKARRLIKQALGDSGECGKYHIDLTFRKCKYPTWQANDEDLVNNASWCKPREVV